jgi:hypothetical protein
MIRTPRSILLGVLVLRALPAAAQDELPAPERYVLRVEYLRWSPALTGQVQKGIGDLEGTLLDVKQDLGIGEAGAHTLRGSVRLGRTSKLRGSWVSLDYRGDVESGRPFTYGSTVVGRGDRVVTSFKGNYFTTEVEWDFLIRGQGFLGLLAGVKYFDVDTLLANVDTSSRVVETEKIPIPVLGLAGRAYVHPRLSLEGEISGLPAGDRGHAFEILLAARLHVSDRLAATGGWRKLTLEGRDDRDYFNLRLGTWTFGVELSL